MKQIHNTKVRDNIKSHCEGKFESQVYYIDDSSMTQKL